MSMGELHRKIAERRQLVYDNELRDFFRANPGIIRQCLTLVDQILKIDKNERRKRTIEYQDGDLTVSMHPRYNDEPIPWSNIFKVTYKGKVFALKIATHNQDISGGAREIESAREAAELFKPIKGVKVVEYLLGYKDKKNRNFLLSKWYDLSTLSKLFEHQTLSPKVREEVEDRYAKAKSILLKNNFVDDMHEGNVFYDQENDELVFFDLNKKSSIGNLLNEDKK